MKGRLHDNMANQNFVNPIGVLGPEALPIAFQSLAVPGKTVPRLLNSGRDPAGQDWDGIKEGLPAELKLLRGSQWSRIRFLANEVVREHA